MRSIPQLTNLVLSLFKHSYEEKQTGLAVNIAIICLVLAGPYYVIFKLLELPFSQFFVIPTISTYVVAIILMRLELYTFGKFLIIGGTSASLYSYAAMLGKGAGAQLLLYSMIPLPLFLFKPKQRIQIALGSAIPIVASFGLEFSGYSGPFFKESLSINGQFWLYIIASATTFSILILSTYANFKASQSYETKLEEKNRELEQNISLLHQSNQDLSLALTDLKKSQYEIQSMAQQATLGAIMRGIVHEVKGPLTAIRACCSVVLMEDRLPESARDRISSIQNYLNQLSELTKTLLADSGSIAWMDSPLDISRLIEQVLKLVDNEGFIKKVKILRDFPNTLPTVKGSSAYISQAILNLLINALRFSPENTSIIVSIRVDNKWVKIQVSDQGPGVSESIRTTLFHSGITTSQPGGTNVGLGLHFVQRVADAHGGKIELIDTGDHGSTFELSLPIVQSQEKKGAQT